MSKRGVHHDGCTSAPVLSEQVPCHCAAQARFTRLAQHEENESCQSENRGSPSSFFCGALPPEQCRAANPAAPPTRLHCSFIAPPRSDLTRGRTTTAPNCFPPRRRRFPRGAVPPLVTI